MGSSPLLCCTWAMPLFPQSISSPKLLLSLLVERDPPGHLYAVGHLGGPRGLVTKEPTQVGDGWLWEAFYITCMDTQQYAGIITFSPPLGHLDQGTYDVRAMQHELAEPLWLGSPFTDILDSFVDNSSRSDTYLARHSQ
ncbi:hypothetical protein NDU88_002648 [Pleurodeles waltl]|uniref:Uncharacterized protein n=1 Tax=Pleurodeles waltl TaxID=8319 RepID=A0AAV7PAA5_PLEWA|nr:hypothetical protein NDU88_002648 [Pleurodeles waltl]